MHLNYFAWYLQAHVESLIRVIAGLSSTALEEIHVHLLCNDLAPLETRLGTLRQLRSVDDLLPKSQFPCLHRVVLNYQPIRVCMDDIPLAYHKFQTAPTHSMKRVGKGSDATYHIVSMDDELDEEAHEFKLRAEPLVHRKNEEVMSQLSTCGILVINLRLWPL